MLVSTMAKALEYPRKIVSTSQYKILQHNYDVTYLKSKYNRTDDS